MEINRNWFSKEAANKSSFSEEFQCVLIGAWQLTAHMNVVSVCVCVCVCVCVSVCVCVYVCVCV